MLDACALQGGSGALTSCTQHTTDYLTRIGVLSSLEAQAINACASR